MATAAETGAIILQDDRGRATPVPPQALTNVFALLKDNIRVVVLNACFSQPQAEAIAQHIDCVVGMSEEIGDTAARDFAAAFYGALAYGRSVKTAFELGRNQIDLAGLQDQDVPQLLAPNSDPTTVNFVMVVMPRRALPWMQRLPLLACFCKTFRSAAT